MKPWDEEAKDLGDDEIEKLWISTLASDFIFAHGKPGIIIITPAVYYADTGYCYDQHLQISHVLPNCLKQRQEDTFFYRCSLEKVVSDLQVAGFCHSQELQAFMLDVVKSREG